MSTEWTKPPWTYEYVESEYDDPYYGIFYSGLSSGYDIPAIRVVVDAFTENDDGEMAPDPEYLEVARLISLAPEMAVRIKRTEFVQDSSGAYWRCPDCSNTPHEGHAKDCPTESILQRLGES